MIKETLPCIDCICLPVCKAKLNEDLSIPAKLTSCKLLRPYVLLTIDNGLDENGISSITIKLREKNFKEAHKYLRGRKNER